MLSPTETGSAKVKTSEELCKKTSGAHGDAPVLCWPRYTGDSIVRSVGSAIMPYYNLYDQHRHAAAHPARTLTPDYVQKVLA
jgi:hypothetical protein